MYNRKNSAFLMLICLLSFFGAAGQVRIHESLSPREYKARLDSIAGAKVIDLRTRDELRDGVITGAVNIDFYGRDFSRRLSALDKTKPYFIYCAKGGRSADAMEMMDELGFTEVYNLEDGFSSWKEAGLPVAPYKK